MLTRLDKERVAEQIIELLAKEGASMFEAKQIFEYIDNTIYKRVGLVPLNQAGTLDPDSQQ